MSEQFIITDRAASRIGKILASEGEGAMLRVSVEGGGCSGFQYKFGVDKVKAEDDLTFVRNGITVLVDPVSVNYLAGSELDYRRRPDRRVVPRQQSERHRVLRLRHEFFGLGAAGVMPPTADALLKRFPGPVTLFVERWKKLVVLAGCVVLAPLFFWFWYTGDNYKPYSWFMTPFVALVSVAFFVKSVVLLAFPKTASPTLDADGFEIGHVFWVKRVPWHSIANFYMPEGAWHVVCTQVEGETRRGTVNGNRPLPDHYGLPKEELVLLMNGWRERALAR